MDLEIRNITATMNQTQNGRGLRTDDIKDERAARAAAEKFETSFLAEMLKHTGVGKPPETFNGGAGEDAFAGMLTWEYAEEITARGTVGLADQVYKVLLERMKP